MKRFRAAKHRASFALLFKTHGDARLIEVHDVVRDVLTDYHDSCRACGHDYPFSFSLSTTSNRQARLYEVVVLDVVREARERFYPFTIDWYAVQYREKEKQHLLTFALRPCDLRELIGSPRKDPS